MKKPGRPRLKAKEKKEIFPLRLSSVELKAIRDAAGDEPLAKWMRRKLLGATPEGELPALSPKTTQAVNSARADEGIKKMVARMTDPKQGPHTPPRLT